MAFELPPLPYAYDALEVSIDAQTMEIHHDKHHKAYVDKLNAAIADKADLSNKTLNALIGNIKGLPQDIQLAVRNNGGGHWNHSFFWEILSPKGGGDPKGKVAEALNKRFGSFAQFKEQFSTVAANRFGSGWAWLIVRDGELFIESTPNQDNHLMDITDKPGLPVLGLDVWEHAYYLRYQNRRPEYITNFFNIINWEKVNANFEQAMR